MLKTDHSINLATTFFREFSQVKNPINDAPVPGWDFARAELWKRPHFYFPYLEKIMMARLATVAARIAPHSSWVASQRDKRRVECLQLAVMLSRFAFVNSPRLARLMLPRLLEEEFAQIARDLSYHDLAAIIDTGVIMKNSSLKQFGRLRVKDQFHAKL